MGSVRKSLFINEANQDILAWFEGVKSPSDAICRLIREESTKNREIELLKQIIEQQQQTIRLYESMLSGTNITITQQDNHLATETIGDIKEEIEEEDHSIDDPDMIMNMLGSFTQSE